MKYAEFKIKVRDEIKQWVCCLIERISQKQTMNKDIYKEYCLVVWYIWANLISTRRYNSVDEVFKSANKKKYRQWTMHFYNWYSNRQPSWQTEKVIRNTKEYNITTWYTNYYCKVMA